MWGTQPWGAGFENLKGKMTILVDGGIHNGADILKMLALGADAVLIGRSVARGVVGGHATGVKFILNKLELRAAMVLTGTLMNPTSRKRSFPTEHSPLSG